MLTARSFLAWLLAALVVAAGVTVVAHSLVDGAAAAVLVPAGLICLLPHPEEPVPGEWRVTVVEPASQADILWAEDWGEPLVRYRFPAGSTGEPPRPTARSRPGDASGQVHADRRA